MKKALGTHFHGVIIDLKNIHKYRRCPKFENETINRALNRSFSPWNLWMFYLRSRLTLCKCVLSAFTQRSRRIRNSTILFILLILKSIVWIGLEFECKKNCTICVCTLFYLHYGCCILVLFSQRGRNIRSVNRINKVTKITLCMCYEKLNFNTLQLSYDRKSSSSVHLYVSQQNIPTNLNFLNFLIL